MTANLQAEARFFREQGYLILRQALPQDRLPELVDRAEAIRQRAETLDCHGIRYWLSGSGSASPDELDSGQDRRDWSWGVNEITRPDLVDPPLIDVLALPRIAATLAALLDRPRAWGQKLLWAPRATRYDLGWHRDIDQRYEATLPYKPAANDHIQFNAALRPDRSFIVVPGSHRRLLAPAERECLASEGATAVLPGQQRVELDPGDVVVMDAHAIHRGQADAGAPRLSLHFSCQAQWVPLMPWGREEDFAFICSEAFHERLAPATRACYRRLRSAQRAPTQHDWLLDHARTCGWSGEAAPAWPQRRR